MKNSKNYRNITKSFMKKSTPNSHKIKDAEYFENAKGNKYYVDGKNVVRDYSESEKNVANWLKETFGGEIYMLPRVNIPEGIETADYLFHGEKLDLKEINGIGKNNFFHSVENHNKQSNNFILDVSKSQLNIIEIKQRISKLYSLPKLMWIEKIIVKKNDTLLLVVKKETTPPINGGTAS